MPIEIGHVEAIFRYPVKYLHTPDGEEMPAFAPDCGHGRRTSVRGSRADDGIESWHLR